MPSTNQSIVVNAEPGTVWDRISDFHDMSWAPGVINNVTKVGDKAGNEIGARRILNNAFHETLIEWDAEGHLFRYSIDDGPSPVSRDEVSAYIGAVKLGPNAGQDGTLVSWTSSWESNSEDAVAFCHGIYVALLNELAASFS